MILNEAELRGRAKPCPWSGHEVRAERSLFLRRWRIYCDYCLHKGAWQPVWHPTLELALYRWNQPRFWVRGYNATVRYHEGEPFYPFTESEQAELFRAQLATLLAQYEAWQQSPDGDVFLIHKVEELLKHQSL